MTDQRIKFFSPVEGMKKTVKLIGNSIKQGSTYLPIRNHAAALAAKAPAKNYKAQIKNVYDDFTKRWRYVMDPLGTETVTNSPQALYSLVMGFNGGVGGGLGAGDCDDAAAAMGAQLRSIGMPVRIATTAPINHRGKLFTHVFVQTRPPNSAHWITADPVGFPKHELGWITPHSRLALWGLNGELLGGSNIDANFLNFGTIENKQEEGFSNMYDDNLAAWDKTVLQDFGSSINMLGYMPDANHLSIEIDPNNVDEFGNVRTPMIELSNADYEYIKGVNYPYNGMQGLSDEGEIYTYDSGLGFFKRARKRFKKIRRGIRKRVRRALRRTKLGRWAVKIGDKIRKVAMKFVKPLLKFVGKYAGKIAPIAALIPGFGPAIAGALVASGKIAKMMQKSGIMLAVEKGSKVRRLAMKNPKMLKLFKKQLQKEAKKLKRGRSSSQIKRMASRLKKAPNNLLGYGY